MTAIRKPCILIVDDQADVREALRLLLKSAELESVAAAHPRQALEMVATNRFAAALIDMNYQRDTTSGAEGIELLGVLQRSDPDLPVIVMTAWGSIDLAVRAIQAGARDFVEKPWDNTRLLTVLRNQLALAASGRRERRLRAENALLRSSQVELIAQSRAMRDLLAKAARVARTDSAVLLVGENGTGKGVLARHLHALSGRREQPFVHADMGGFASSVFESEMFGHVRGAFTDAKADRVGRIELAESGTLFLDEVANLPLPLQPKLLRVIESGAYERLGSSRTEHADVRIISATNADLQQAVSDGQFRADLLYRLNAIELRVPPLRERRDDIVPLAESFLLDALHRHGSDLRQLSSAARRKLREYQWPGNVRELQHAIERAVILGSQAELGAEDFELPDLPTKVDSSASTLSAAEHALIRDALAQHGGNIVRTAAALGVSRGSLYRRLQKLRDAGSK